MKNKSLMILFMILISSCGFGSKSQEDRHDRHKRWVKINNLDRVEILRACQEMIDLRELYRNDNERHPLNEKDVVIDQEIEPLDDRLPKIVLELNPKYVAIRDDYVLMHFGPARFSLLCFGEGARQYGTIRLGDSLWYWNGDDHSK